MRHLTTPLTLLVLSLLVGAPASAQAPATTFATTATFQRCTETWAHACMQRDASGNVFGTAHRMTHCTRYELAPDGRITLYAMPGLVDSIGTYRIDGDTVRIELLDEQGQVRHRESLLLGVDGRSLGDLRRIEPEAG